MTLIFPDDLLLSICLWSCTQLPLLCTVCGVFVFCWTVDGPVVVAKCRTVSRLKPTACGAIIDGDGVFLHK